MKYRNNQHKPARLLVRIPCRVFRERPSGRARETTQFIGGHKVVARPDPIPNSAVKHHVADGSSSIGSARVGSCLTLQKNRSQKLRSFLCLDEILKNYSWLNSPTFEGNNCNIVFPTVIRSPNFTLIFVRRSPFTHVPSRLPKSSIQYSPSSSQIFACFRLTDRSSAKSNSGVPFELFRPIVTNVCGTLTDFVFPSNVQTIFIRQAPTLLPAQPRINKNQSTSARQP